MRKRIGLYFLLACSTISCSARCLAIDEFRQLNNEGFKHLRNGEYERAVEKFNQSLQLNPDYGIARGNRGIAYFLLGRFADALNDFQSLQATLPNSDAALKVYLTEARMGKADPARLTELEAHVDSPTYHVVIDYYLGRTTIDAAADNLRNTGVQFARVGPNRKAALCYAYFYFGERAIVQGDRTDAIRMLRRSVDTGIKDLPEYIWAKGELEKLQNRPEALTLSPALQSVPTSVPVLPQGPGGTQPVEQGVPSSTTGESAASRNSHPSDPGVIEGHTYRNSSIGIELTVPEELFFDSPDVITFAGTQQFAITVQADTKPHNRFTPRKYVVDEEVRLNAEPLAAHSLDERSLEGYMHFVSQSVLKTGFRQIDGPSVAALGDIQFSRGNFAHGHRLHTILVALDGDYAISIFVVSNDAATAERLIRSISLKLENSGAQ